MYESSYETLAWRLLNFDIFYERRFIYLVWMEVNISINLDFIVQIYTNFGWGMWWLICLLHFFSSSVFYSLKLYIYVKTINKHVRFQVFWSNLFVKSDVHYLFSLHEVFQFISLQCRYSTSTWHNPFCVTLWLKIIHLRLDGTYIHTYVHCANVVQSNAK